MPELTTLPSELLRGVAALDRARVAAGRTAIRRAWPKANTLPAEDVALSCRVPSRVAEHA